ncbi:hypothetical protein GUJ93_ZPchr0012g21882 [Zizania palustris]|uniref:Uncharacterized protein n=1 Tax=Zizania palustris TaxID=103762 RepID=A0A8J6BP15_ZIZPA|nr:hypothetical protein GUJ93_ZPchr0012g21882 [Zizania palustris]
MDPSPPRLVLLHFLYFHSSRSSSLLATTIHPSTNTVGFTIAYSLPATTLFKSTVTGMSPTSSTRSFLIVLLVFDLILPPPVLISDA